jgi:hypothetical protein
MSVAAQASRQRTRRIGHPSSVRARAWNRRVWAVVHPETLGTLGTLPFFCECGLDYCRSSVWLTLREANEVFERGRLIIGAHFFRDFEARISRPG